MQGWQSPSESQAAGMPIAGLKENYVNGKSVRSIVCILKCVKSCVKNWVKNVLHVYSCIRCL